MENVPEISTLPAVQIAVYRHPLQHFNAFWQIIRFGIVGFLNATIDLLTLNILSFIFKTHNVDLLLLYNTVAYAFGALNSYLLNKYWTFRHKRSATRPEVLRFVLLSVVGILCNNGLLWVAASVFHPFIANTLLWLNLSKVIAILGTSVVSYIGMRLWVFTLIPTGNIQGKEVDTMSTRDPEIPQIDLLKSRQVEQYLTTKSLSVILPAYNEEEVIATVIDNILTVLTPWVRDLEVIVVNDGSKDKTRAIVAAISTADPRVCLVNHEANQGYGSALVSGFTAASKELSFFTDADGQFDIHDIVSFFGPIETYDAVLGYRVNRQDTLLRKINASAWKMLVKLVLGVSVRDVDCAFKLYRTEFVHRLTLETRGAMINAEMLFKLKRYGYTHIQVGVQHFPRTTGQATGAKLSVIAHAMCELFIYAWKWRREVWN